MPDQNLGITGRDVQITIMLDGALIATLRAQPPTVRFQVVVYNGTAIVPLPAPDVPNKILPGRDCANAINSLSDFTPNPGLTSTTDVGTPICATPVNSFKMSYIGLTGSTELTTIALEIINSV